MSQIHSAESSIGDRTNQTAIVTGAGSGIGKAVAVALSQNGFQVVLAGRGLQKLESVAAEIDGASGASMAISTDVTDPNQVADLFDKTVQKFGRVDLLFNNAGINIPSVELDEIPIEEWNQIVATNLTGVFLCTQNAFRVMKTQQPMGGRIINNGSVSAQVPRPNSIGYTATKHAVTGITKSSSLDGRKYNIACGQIDIGNATSDMTSRMSSGVPQADGSKKPEPTFAVDNVANAVVYMSKLPLDANVPSMTVMATKMPLVGRG